MYVNHYQTCWRWILLQLDSIERQLNWKETLSLAPLINDKKGTIRAKWYKHTSLKYTCSTMICVIRLKTRQIYYNWYIKNATNINCTTTNKTKNLNAVFFRYFLSLQFRFGWIGSYLVLVAAILKLGFIIAYSCTSCEWQLVFCQSKQCVTLLRLLLRFFFVTDVTA